MPTSEIVVTHSDCVCNEELALTCRHQARVPNAQRSWEELDVTEDSLTPIQPWTRKKVIDYYGGAKRKEFERAYDSLMADPLEHKDGQVRMFLKADKYHAGETFRVKAPRCIQFRTKRYGLELGKYVHPMEHDLYANVLDGSGTPVYAKSRNSVQRASDLLEKSREFDNPVFLLLDQSNWDAHVNKALLKYEHSLYLRKCPSHELAKLLKYQLTNRGATKNGTRYQTAGTRMSGDMNTALGNCVINYALLHTWAREAGIKACFYVDGDDSVVVFDKQDVAKAAALDPATWFLGWGMESKVEWAFQLEHCEFCQCRPVWDGVGWRMVRNPERFMIRSQWTTLPHHENFFPRLVTSIGRCELASAIGVPIIQALALSMIEAGGAHKTWRQLDAYKRARMEAWQPDRAHLAVRAVTEESRASMEVAWGITPAEQVAMEKSCLKLALTSQADWATYLLHFAGDNSA